MASSHIEIEIKLSGEDKAFAALLNDASKNEFKIEKREWRVQTYYDTFDLDLFANDLELRVRPAKGDYRQTVKRLISLSQDGVFTRDERQSAQSSELPDFKKLKPFLPKSLSKQTAKDLHPLMRTEFTRRRFLMNYKKTALECAVDEGHLVFLGVEGELVRPFRLAELEVKSGNEADMILFAHDLQNHYGLTPLRLTKPEQAVELGFQSGALTRIERREAVASKLAKRIAD